MQKTNLAFALDAQPEETTREALRDELAQFISEELIAHAAPRRPPIKALKRRPVLWNQRIKVDNGSFTLFRVC